MLRSILLFTWLLAGISCQLSGQPAARLEPAEFQQKLLQKGAQLLDVRTADEFKTGYISGALQANWLNNAEFADRTQHLDNTRPVYVYCASGKRSAEAAQQLREKGFVVEELAGGLNRWKKESLPVVVETPVTQLEMKDYESLIRQSPVVLVDFGAAWCPPCRKMEPVLEALRLSQGQQFSLQKIDAGVNTNLMKALNIEPLPHFILYKNGVKTWEKQGIVTLEEFKQAIL